MRAPAGPYPAGVDSRPLTRQSKGNMMPASPTELDTAIRAVARKIRNEREHQDERPRYRCPKCSSSELSSDAEVWAKIDPNTREVLSNLLRVPAVLSGQDGPDEPDPEHCYTHCLDCGFDSDRLADFDTRKKAPTP
jgi:hypothetical protein